MDAAVRMLLRRCRRVVAAELALIVESHCVVDAARRPIRATLEDSVKPEVRRMERLIRDIDTAIGRKR